MKNRIVCVVMGILFLLIPCYLRINYEIKKTQFDSVTQSIKTTYKIKKRYDREKHSMTTLYTPVYHFLVGKTSYVCISQFSSDSIPETVSKKIYYKSYNPCDCLPERGIKEDIVFCAFGLFGVISILYGSLYKKIKNIKYGKSICIKTK